VPSLASARFTNGVALGAAQGCGRALSGEYPAVEQLHEIHRGAIIDRPDGEQEIDGVVAGRVDVLTDTQAIELDWLKGNKFHEGIEQALHYGDVTGQQPVLALISAYYNIFGAKQQKREYVSGLCAACGVEVWALTTRRE
jgi:hypothetical protein